MDTLILISSYMKYNSRGRTSVGINNNTSQRHNNELKKSDGRILIYTMWFHSCEVHEQARQINVDRNWNDDYWSGAEILTGKGHEGAFSGNENVLIYDLGGGYTVCTHAHTHTRVKIHQPVCLRLIYFAAYKCVKKKLGNLINFQCMVF